MGANWCPGWESNPHEEKSPEDFKFSELPSGAILFNRLHSNPLRCNAFRCTALHAIAPSALPQCYTR